MAKHEDLPIPIYSALALVYGTAGQQFETARIRFDHLKSKFIKLFGIPPDVYARSPGQVNLIGEHIDYEGYSVLPMAICQDTIVGIRKHDAGHGEKLIRIGNANDSKYTMCTYPADPNQEIDTNNHKWGHYFICGYKGLYEFAKLRGRDVGRPVGLDVIVYGTVLPVRTTNSVMAALNMNFPKREIAQLTCECERHIGTQSGGMDQISCLRSEQMQLSRSLEKERQRAAENRQEYLALKEEADTNEGRVNQLKEEIKQLKRMHKLELQDAFSHHALLQQVN